MTNKSKWNLNDIIPSLEYQRDTDPDNFMWMHDMFLALALTEEGCPCPKCTVVKETNLER